MKAVALVACLALAGCATAGSTLNTPHAVLQRSEDAAEIAYQGTVAALQAAEAAGKISAATETKDWQTAWSDLMTVRRYYNAGQDISGLVVKLQAEQAAAKGL